jgi:hypothetical protein
VSERKPKTSAVGEPRRQAQAAGPRSSSWGRGLAARWARASEAFQWGINPICARCVPRLYRRRHLQLCRAFGKGHRLASFRAFGQLQTRAQADEQAVRTSAMADARQSRAPALHHVAISRPVVFMENEVERGSLAGRGPAPHRSRRGAIRSETTECVTGDQTARQGAPKKHR